MDENHRELRSRERQRCSLLRRVRRSCPRQTPSSQVTEAITAFEGSITRSRESRTGLESEPLRLSGLAEALLRAGDHRRALESAEESVALALERASEFSLTECYRVLAEAVLAGDGEGRIAAAQEAIDNAIATGVETTGARGELPFIERARRQLIPVA